MYPVHTVEFERHFCHQPAPHHTGCTPVGTGQEWTFSVQHTRLGNNPVQTQLASVRGGVSRIERNSIDQNLVTHPAPFPFGQQEGTNQKKTTTNQQFPGNERCTNYTNLTRLMCKQFSWTFFQRRAQASAAVWIKTLGGKPLTLRPTVQLQKFGCKFLSCWDIPGIVWRIYRKANWTTRGPEQPYDDLHSSKAQFQVE